MQNAESIRRRLDSVKKMRDTQAALCELADIQYDIGISACKERTKLQEELNNLRKVIVGNGDPENSILNRMAKVEGCLDGVKGDTVEIKEALIGNLKDGKRGLNDRVDSLEKIGGKIDKLFWFFVFTILAEIAAAIFAVIGII